MLFPDKKGMPVKPLRTALGALIIQKQYEYSDRDLRSARIHTISFSSDFPDIRTKNLLKY